MTESRRSRGGGVYLELPTPQTYGLQREKVRSSFDELVAAVNEVPGGSLAMQADSAGDLVVAVIAPYESDKLSAAVLKYRHWNDRATETTRSRALGEWGPTLPRIPVEIPPDAGGTLLYVHAHGAIALPSSDTSFIPQDHPFQSVVRYTPGGPPPEIKVRASHAEGYLTSLTNYFSATNMLPKDFPLAMRILHGSKYAESIFGNGDPTMEPLSEAAWRLSIPAKRVLASRLIDYSDDMKQADESAENFVGRMQSRFSEVIRQISGELGPPMQL